MNSGTAAPRRGAPRRRTTASIIGRIKAGLGLTLLSATALVPLAGPVAAQTPPQPLGKSGTDVLTGSTTTVGAGDTLRWVVEAGNPKPGPVSATITDPIQSAGEDQTYVPGSLQAPPGYIKGWSTDGGTTFSTTDAGAATNVVRASNDNVQSPATGAGSLLPPPLQTVATPTGGDGLMPVLYTTAAGAPQIWNFYHHVTGPLVVCTDRLTGGRCAGFSGAKYMSTTPGPFNAGPSDVHTGTYNTVVNDPVNRDVVWGTVGKTSSPTSIGMICINLATQATCGYTPLTTSISPVHDELGEPQIVGTKIYTAARPAAQMLCFDVATSAACPGQPYPFISNGYFAITPANNGRIYGSAIDVNNLSAWCFDTATNAICTGWPKVVHSQSWAGAGGHGAEFYTYDAAGAVTGLCVGWSYGTVFQMGCVDLAGNAVPDPPGFLLNDLAFTSIGWVSSLEVLQITAPNGHVASYIPVEQTAFGGPFGRARSGTICYDWTTSSPCAASNTGFPGFVRYPNVNGGDTRDYGYAFDGQCMFGLGDAGFLWTFDPITGSSPCSKTQVTVALNPASFYCDGKAGHVQSYGTVSLKDIDLSTVNFTTSSVTIKDSDGNVLGTFPLDPSTGSASISAIPVTAGGIVADFDIVLLNGSSFTSTMHPRALVTFVGDAPQMCFQTVAAQDCTIGSISNQATATYTDASGTTTVQSPVVSLALTGGGASGSTSTHGSAYGLDVAALNLHPLNKIGNVATVQPGSPADAARRIATVSLPGLVNAGIVTTSSDSTLTPFPSSTSTASTANVNLLGGAVKADLIKGVSQTSASPESVTYNSAGSTFVGLTVNGQPLTNVAPNTTVQVKNPLIPSQVIAAAHLYEEQGTSSFGDGVANASHFVNMIRIVLVKPFLTLPAGAEIIVSHAQSDVTTPACAQATKSVSGEAFTAFVKGTLAGQTLAATKVGQALLPATGGANSDGTAVTVPGVVVSGTATNTTSGSREPNPNATARSVVQGANVLNGLVTATVLDVASTSSANGTTAGTTFATTFIDLKVAGIQVANNPEPNTVIAVPMSGGGLLRVVLNERVVNTNGTTDTEGTVNAIHATVFGSSGLFQGEVIVASAHSDAHL